jgi:hypothetical protein
MQGHARRRRRSQCFVRVRPQVECRVPRAAIEAAMNEERGRLTVQRERAGPGDGIATAVNRPAKFGARGYLVRAVARCDTCLTPPSEGKGGNARSQHKHRI